MRLHYPVDRTHEPAWCCGGRGRKGECPLFPCIVQGNTPSSRHWGGYNHPKGVGPGEGGRWPQAASIPTKSVCANIVRDRVLNKLSAGVAQHFPPPPPPSRSPLFLFPEIPLPSPVSAIPLWFIGRKLFYKLTVHILGPYKDVGDIETSFWYRSSPWEIPMRFPSTIVRFFDSWLDRAVYVEKNLWRTSPIHEVQPTDQNFGNYAIGMKMRTQRPQIVFPWISECIIEISIRLLR